MILVIAANGNQGKLLVPKLPVRACVQSQASAERLRALGVQEVVVGDISQPDVMAEAVRGVEKVCATPRCRCWRSRRPMCRPS